MLRGARALAVGMASVITLVACGDDGESSSPPPVPTTVAPTTSTTLSQIQLDQQKARRVVLTVVDVPGYTEDAPAPSDEIDPETEAAVLACLNSDPLTLRLGDEADARGVDGPDFSKGDDTVSSSVTFGATEDEARASMTALNATSFPACFSRALSAGLRKDGTLTNVIVTTTKLPAITAGDQSVGFRSVLRFRAEGTAVTVNAENTFIRSGRGLSVLAVTTVTTPFPAAERTRLVTTIAGRMAAP